MRKFLSSGTLIAAIGIRGALNTAAVAVILHLIHSAKIHFPPVSPNS